MLENTLNYNMAWNSLPSGEEKEPEEREKWVDNLGEFWCEHSDLILYIKMGNGWS